MAERPARPVLVLHPFLFAALPILFLYTYNASSLYVSPTELGLPLVLAVGLPLLAWLGLRLAFRSGTKAGLAVSLFLVLFYSLVPLADALSARASWFRTWQLGALLPAFLSVGCWLVARSRRDFRQETILLNLAAGVMLALNIGLNLPVFLQSRPAGNLGTPGVLEPGQELPDIFYIVPDGHARSDILREMYDCNDSGFVAGLRARGFFVADQARANYSQTYLSLGSALNMTYVDSLARLMGPESDDRRPLERWLLHNRVMRELRGRGYRVISFASGYSGTDFKEVDARFAPWWMPTEFRALVVSITPIGALLDAFTHKSLPDLHRDRVEYIFSRMPTAARGPGPALVFAHILCPHPPFVFGPEGEPLEVPGPLFSLGDGVNYHNGEPELVERYIERYRGQVRFVEGRLLTMVDEILEQSDRPPVIIIHADHGPKSRSVRDEPRWTCFPERQAILYAVLMPDRDYTGWHDSITPVNTFRLVLDRLFDDTLGILPDRSYFATWARPYEFYDVDRWPVAADSAE